MADNAVLCVLLFFKQQRSYFDSREKCFGLLEVKSLFWNTRILYYYLLVNITSCVWLERNLKDAGLEISRNRVGDNLFRASLVLVFYTHAIYDKNCPGHLSKTGGWRGKSDFTVVLKSLKRLYICICVCVCWRSRARQAHTHTHVIKVTEMSGLSFGSSPPLDRTRCHMLASICRVLNEEGGASFFILPFDQLLLRTPTVSVFCHCQGKSLLSETALVRCTPRGVCFKSDKIRFLCWI